MRAHCSRLVMPTLLLIAASGGALAAADGDLGESDATMVFALGRATAQGRPGQPLRQPLGRPAAQAGARPDPPGLKRCSRRAPAWMLSSCSATAGPPRRASITAWCRASPIPSPSSASPARPSTRRRRCGRCSRCWAKPAEVPGADAAIVFPDASGGAPTLAFFGEQVAFAVNGLPTRFPPPAEPAADLVVEVALAKLCAAEAAVATGERAKELTAIAKALEGFGKVHYEASLVPEGIKEKAILPHVVGLKPVDRSVLEPLPASTLITLAVGLDGPGLREADHVPARSRRSPSACRPPGQEEVAPAEVQSQADALLGFLGVPLSLKQVTPGLRRHPPGDRHRPGPARPQRDRRAPAHHGDRDSAHAPGAGEDACPAPGGGRLGAGADPQCPGVVQSGEGVRPLETHQRRLGDDRMDRA